MWRYLLVLLRKMNSQMHPGKMLHTSEGSPPLESEGGHAT
jgi:hypothetical protein